MSDDIEDKIHRRISKIQFFMESIQHELVTLQNELNNVTIQRGRQISSLTESFSMLNSPSAESPNPRNQKRRARKNTPEFRRRVYEVDDRTDDTPLHLRVSSAQVEQRRRIQPTLVPRQQEPGNLESDGNALHRSYAIGGNFKQLEQEWKKKRQETLANKQPLASLGMKTYREVTTDEEFEIDEDEHTEMFLPSFKFKGKGHSKENTKMWIKRLYSSAILKGMNPIRGKGAIDFILTKLGRVARGFQVTRKEVLDAEDNFPALRTLFKRMVEFINSKTSDLKM